MIKVESIEGVCTIVRGEEECVLFVGMILNDGELESLKGGKIAYTVDEGPVQTAEEVKVVQTPAPKAAPATK